MENKCNTCFYALMDRDLEAPCVTCTGYSNYVKGTIYMTQSHGAQPLKEAIDEWFKDEVDQVREDFWVSYKGITHDPVEKPKHYMLFDAEFVNATAYLKEGIEVRDVIERLVGKLPKNAKPMFIADYVQMMQYLMRFMDKNGVEDLKKARVYLNWLIEAYDNTEKA